jgi:hypothetical protein
MRTRATLLLLALFVLCSSATTASAETPALEDQFRLPHELQSYLGPKLVTIIIAGNKRSTAETMQPWFDLLKTQGIAQMMGLADMRGLPFFVPKSIVRERLVKLYPKTTILLDFDGKTTDALGIVAGEANAYVYLGGELASTLVGPPTEGKVAAIFRLVNAWKPPAKE